MPDKRIDTLFSRLGAIYGHLWWRLYQQERMLAFAKKEWSDGLRRFDNRTLKEALLQMREHQNYPPALPQFIECCKAISKRYEVPAMIQAAETKPPTNTKIGDAYLKAMFKLLR